MSKFVYFTREEKEFARTTDIASLLCSQGEKLKRIGKEYQWRDGSEKVYIRGHLWFHQYSREGGDAVEFVRKFFDKDYTEAMEFLLSKHIGSVQNTTQEIKPLVLPQRNDNMRRVYAYLINQRGVNREVIHVFAHYKMIYESSPHHNVVFVGFDNEGKPCHVHKRGSGSQNTYKCTIEGSQPEFSFHWNGTSDKLYLFESPIDMLSYISMHPINWKENTYVAACSISDKALFQCLKDNQNIHTVYLCLDNDDAGRNATERITEKLFVKGYKTEVLIPKYKDWNEDLIYCMKVGEM